MTQEPITDRRVEVALADYFESVPQRLVDQSRSLLATRQHAGPGVLLSRTVDAVTDQEEVRSIGPAIAAVEFLDAYRITRNALCWKEYVGHTDDLDVDTLLLMGDFLHALAFEAIGEMDQTPRIVIDAYLETVRGSLQSTAAWHGGIDAADTETERTGENPATVSVDAGESTAIDPDASQSGPERIEMPGFGPVAGRIGAQIAGGTEPTCERCAAIGRQYDRAIGLHLRSAAETHGSTVVEPQDVADERIDRAVDGGLDLIEELDTAGNPAGLRKLFAVLRP